MGKAAPEIDAGQCCLIHTGGMLPANADAVVMIEDTEATGDTIHVYRQVAPGENVIHRGEDLGRGDRAIAAGSCLRSAEIGLLASMGATRVKVYRRPVMGLLSTGDELIPYTSQKLEPGRIREDVYKRQGLPPLLYPFLLRAYHRHHRPAPQERI